jgi:hypothetical protein
MIGIGNGAPAAYGPKKNYDLCEESLSQYQRSCIRDEIGICDFNAADAKAHEIPSVSPARINACGILRNRISSSDGVCKEVHKDCNNKRWNATETRNSRQCRDVFAEYLGLSCTGAISSRPQHFCRILFTKRNANAPNYCKEAWKVMVHPEGACQAMIVNCMMRYHINARQNRTQPYVG